MPGYCLSVFGYELLDHNGVPGAIWPRAHRNAFVYRRTWTAGLLTFGEMVPIPLNFNFADEIAPIMFPYVENVPIGEQMRISCVLALKKKNVVHDSLPIVPFRYVWFDILLCCIPSVCRAHLKRPLTIV